MVTLAAVRLKAKTKDLDKIRQAAQADIDNAVYVKQNPTLAPPPAYENALPTNQPIFRDMQEDEEEPDLPSPFAKSLKGFKKKAGPSQADLEKMGAVGGEDYVTINDANVGNGSQTVEVVVEQSKAQRGVDRIKGKVASKLANAGPKPVKQAPTAREGAPDPKTATLPPNFERAIEQNLEVNRPSPQFVKEMESLPDSQGPPEVVEDEASLYPQLPGGDESYVQMWLKK